MMDRLPPARRRLPWLIVGAGATVALLACVVLGVDDLLGLAGRRAEEERTEGADRLTQVGDDEVHGGPTLAGQAPAPRAKQGPVLVRVRDRNGAPMADIEVVAMQPPPQRPAEPGRPPDELTMGRRDMVVGTARTDHAGEARFAELPYDGSVNAEVHRDRGPSSGPTFVDLPSGSLTSDGNTVTVLFGPQEETEGGGSADVTVVSDTTGVFSTVANGGRASFGPVDSPWNVRMPVTGPELTLTLDRGLPLDLEVREGGHGRLRRDVPSAAWPRWTKDDGATRQATLAVLPGDDAHVRLDAKAPAGWVSVPDTTWMSLHPLAQRLEAVVPLRPEVDLVLEVPEVCRPYKVEDCALQITVGGHTLEKPELESLGQERVRVRGAPFYGDDVVTVSGSIGTTWNVSGSARLGDDVQGRVAVPLMATPGAKAEWALASPGSITFTFRTLTRAPLSVVLPDGVEVSKAPLSIRIVAWNGAPATGARVQIGATTLVADASGRVTFPDIVDGPTKVVVLGAGVPLTRELDLHPGARVEHVLEASAGGSLEVEVVDDKERSVPYPRIEITPSDGMRHFEVVDGAQRLDPYGDASGRRTFRFVSAGECKVNVWFGSRWAEAKVTIAEGARESVRIVLPRANP